MNESKRGRLVNLGRQLSATLTSEQRALTSEIEDLSAELSIAERDELIDQIAAHFPGFGPAIVAVAEHLMTLRLGERCACLPASEDKA